MTDTRRTLLVVDDEPNVLKAVKRLLFETEYRILTAESGEEGLIKFSEHDIDLVISDYRMPGMNGVEFLRQVKEAHPETVRLILSGYADVSAVVEAINDGQVYKFIAKPWNDQELLTTIMRALDQQQLERENRRLAGELQARNRELEELARSLEDKVSERTRDLEIRNRALNAVHRLMDYLPVDVVGLNSDLTVAYVNSSAQHHIGQGRVFPGQPAATFFCDEVLAGIQQSVDDEQPRELRCPKSPNLCVFVKPLPDRAGSVCVIAEFNTGSERATIIQRYCAVDKERAVDTNVASSRSQQKYVK